MRLEEYNEISDLVNPKIGDIIDANIAVHHLRSLVRLYIMDEVDIALDQYKRQPLEWYGVYNTNLLYWAVCQELYLTNKNETLKSYAREMLSFAEKHPDNFTYEQDMYTSYLFLGDFKNAVKYAEQWNEKNGGYYDQDLIALKVMNGDREIGLDAISKSKSTNNDYKLWEYNQAKIYTALGMYDEAINMLKESLNHGQYFTWYTYENDIFFKDLLDIDEFTALKSSFISSVR